MYIVPLDMKGCICHFTKWQIHSFISKGTLCPEFVRYSSVLDPVYCRWRCLMIVVNRSGQCDRVIPGFNTLANARRWPSAGMMLSLFFNPYSTEIWFNHHGHQSVFLILNHHKCLSWFFLFHLNTYIML